jgi:hypothetical protein
MISFKKFVVVSLIAIRAISGSYKSPNQSGCLRILHLHIKLSLYVYQLSYGH